MPGSTLPWHASGFKRTDMHLFVFDGRKGPRTYFHYQRDSATLVILLVRFSRVVFSRRKVMLCRTRSWCCGRRPMPESTRPWPASGSNMLTNDIHPSVFDERKWLHKMHRWIHIHLSVSDGRKWLHECFYMLLVWLNRVVCVVRGADAATVAPCQNRCVHGLFQVSNK